MAKLLGETKVAHLIPLDHCSFDSEKDAISASFNKCKLKSSVVRNSRLNFAMRKLSITQLSSEKIMDELAHLLLLLPLHI